MKIPASLHAGSPGKIVIEHDQVILGHASFVMACSPRAGFTYVRAFRIQRRPHHAANLGIVVHHQKLALR